MPFQDRPNVFESLSRFQPSMGEKRIRRPTEDFSTEALVYLLQTSESFRSKFFKKIDCQDLIKDKSFNIETQRSSEHCRADIVIETDGDPQSAVGIEVKIGADYQDEQLKRTAKSFKGRRFLLAPDWRLREDAKLCQKWGFGKISWQQIERMAQEAANAEGAENAFAKDLLHQFSDYLTGLGLNSITMKTYPRNIKSITAMASLLSEWTCFLNSLYGKLGFGKPYHPPRWEKNDKVEGVSYYGIYDTLTSTQSFGYAGFEFRNDTVKLIYQDVQSQNGVKLTPSDAFDIDEKGNVWITKTQGYPATASDSLDSKLTSLFQKLQDAARARAKKRGFKPLKPSP